MSILFIILGILCIVGGILLNRQFRAVLKEIDFRKYRRIPYRRDTRSLYTAEKHSAVLIRKMNADSGSQISTGAFGPRGLEEESTLELARRRVKR